MNRADVAEAGHRGDVDLARRALTAHDPIIRATALGALHRLGALDAAAFRSAFGDSDPIVRRRAAQLAAHHRGVDLTAPLADSDASVVEMAAWTAGEHEDARYVPTLNALAKTHDDPLVRESAVAALGAIGDPAGLAAILQATNDKPAIRRRAIIALTPFEGPEVDEAIEHAKADRDWQVRMVAEELGG